MSLAAGTRIGHYEIVAPLGAGAMGEVYRARDSKLRREVVVKVPAPLFEVRLIAPPDGGIFTTYEYDVNADGSRFLINRMVSPPDQSMTVIVDWNPPR